MKELRYAKYEKDGHVVTITMNRPERLNAFGQELRGDLATAWHRFIEDDEAWVAILTGAGRAFCAGRDIKAQAEGAQRSDSLHLDVFGRYHVPDIAKPIVAAVNGFAFGAGFFMVLGCDIRVAGESAVFAMTEVPTAFLGPYHMAVTNVIPWAIASEIALLGNRVSAQRCYEVGLVNKVVPDSEVMDAAREFAEQLVSLPPLHLRKTKELMLKTRIWATKEQRQEEQEARDFLMTLADTREAASAFVEKRTPRFMAK
ncbi:MAG: hypothetical protein EXR50_01635 [Dehalococcoidia bacterium]|nr:hypothetical protein [Dehalococcoidia bacterium]